MKGVNKKRIEVADYLLPASEVHKAQLASLLARHLDKSFSNFIAPV
jgi:hypothetical protein